MFKEYDIIRCGSKQYVVLESYGSHGKVQENKCNGKIYQKFYWNGQDEYCAKIMYGIDRRFIDD